MAPRDERTWDGEYLWWRTPAGRVRCGVRFFRGHPKGVKMVTAGVAHLPVLSERLPSRLIYRCPTSFRESGEGVEAGPVYAVLAGRHTSSSPGVFVGSRVDFRDLIRLGKERGELVYVVTPREVTTKSLWAGYVRLGLYRWVKIPVPAPQAVYNRIPTRKHENEPMAVAARSRIQSVGIPMFNPRYFNKQDIYKVIKENGLERTMPDTMPHLNRKAFHTMLHKHGAIYLKPSGGSVGHGVIRVERAGEGWTVSALKDTRCETWYVADERSLYPLVQMLRVPGAYILQQAIELIRWNGRPCDFRVLLQKSRGSWSIVGKGVRVSGPNTITTHVPNGGSIAQCHAVLEREFAAQSLAVERAIHRVALAVARAIDDSKGRAYGEMSMDIGVDERGRPWIFEANAKPMKFDEPEIRAKSLVGVLNYLKELSSESMAARTRIRE
ncbi:YheC/YheD family protein [Alicyclobacillus sp. SP_1]|uniref:YheC/YheD family endospore coat-associated protein n=1 Tax=Alicyclobacillus sp. SP_1 TaxID=2942475 RepID=UPI0021582A59|nr:YheC/YheD family protein [Alicyclobacillus sp. SP_1]